ncbi:fructose PTS transporter subunit IIB [Clostridium swellfunianum]|uniref:PTS fructose transporter subunit IIB n=1 Tax=Clostridium swellfunianum TaxID=1367462 RepID=UPI00202FE2C1|nr:PTS fructose transporter subunit IIB [Clostridium swellfunianum]MCM0650797.1 fructose PTS transporter subunit IIB [Clostridium swellfunianum]
MKIIAVTACPTGVAHTNIAARAIEKAAKVLGYDIKVERQGALGIQNRLTKEDIQLSDVVIFAVSQKVLDEQRFSGKVVHIVPVNAPIVDGVGVLQDALKLINEKYI